jgi:hypothetical protein
VKYFKGLRKKGEKNKNKWGMGTEETGNMYCSKYSAQANIIAGLVSYDSSESQIRY